MNLIYKIILAICLPIVSFCQDYPSFGPERQVTITGLTFDAMEPFISPDGEILFFNNLNDGINTKLYYAQRDNDSTFNFIGELNGANQTVPPHLDAVPDIDSLNNFYWTSTREYPVEYDNLFYGDFEDGEVINIGRVRGDFYIYTPGWLIMDHGISYNGQELYYNNARFDQNNCLGPCETRIGIAKKANDSTFNKTSNSDEILQHINDPDYIYYAPCITKDNLELYYTRFLQGDITGATQVEVCVSVRDTPEEVFSVPNVLFSSNIVNIVEAPSLTADKQIMYYHKKVDGIHKIMYRNRMNITGLESYNQEIKKIKIMPNPMRDKVIIKLDPTLEGEMTIRLIDIIGNTVRQIDISNKSSIEIQKGTLKNGLYQVQLQSENRIIASEKLVVK